MARPSTMPPRWVALADAYGGVGKLAEELGISGMHLHRISHHKTGEVRKPTREMIRRAAEAKGVPSPFRSDPPDVPPIPPDALHILELFGGSASLSDAPPEAVARLKVIVSDEQLIALTERAELEPGSVSENALRAAAFLLEA